MQPPAELQLSVLVWHGVPDATAVTTLGSGDPDEYIGKYAHACSATLNLVGWNETQNAFEYVPPILAEFDYQRIAFVGHAPAEWESKIRHEESSPKVRVCLPSQNPWPQTLPPSVKTPFPSFGVFH
jgi:hypothetical protein